MQVENCSKFCFQPNSEKQRIELYNQELNNNNNANSIIESVQDFVALSKLGKTIIVARNHDDHKFYRARLTSSDNNKFKITVCFIDYGRKQNCQIDDIYVFKRQTEQATMPQRCFQCRLAEIQPNLASGNLWDSKAIELFKVFSVDREVKAEVINFLIIINIFETQSFLLIDLFGGEWNSKHFHLCKWFEFKRCFG